jgi:tripartite-type tricarboxylate transporter receptor subunit TctC
MQRRSFLRAWLCAALLAAAPAAAQDYPGRTVTMVIPFTPGGSNDVIGRYLADGLTRLWKQKVIIENKGGAGSIIGTASVARANPDGLTLLFVSASYTTIAAAKAKLPYDPLKDLAPVGLAAVGHMVVVTGKRVPMPTLAELAKQAKLQPIMYGTSGLGASPHFSAALLNEVAGIKMEAVHYRGGTDAMVDVAGERIDVYFGTITQVLPFIEGGKAVPAAIASKTRTPAFPDVPTVAEAGFPGAESDIWWGVFAPAGTPPAIIAKINADMNAVMGAPEAKEFLSKQGAFPSPMTVPDFTKLVVDEIAKWKLIAARHGISIE